jgi:hypothetical protein
MACPSSRLLACSFTTDKDGVVEVLRTLPSQLGLEVKLLLVLLLAQALPVPFACNMLPATAALLPHNSAAAGSFSTRCRQPSHPSPALAPCFCAVWLQDLPIYVGGVSAGASFALKLPNDMPGELSGVVSEVMGLDPAAATEYDVSPAG